MTDVDEAARRLAVTLMRLNEALEMEDAKGYSLEIEPSGQHSRKSSRMSQLQAFYRNWFRQQARET